MDLCEPWWFLRWAGPVGARRRARFNTLPHVSEGDQDGSQPLWTQDTPSGSSLAKGTPTTTKPGPILTSGTTRRPGHLTPAPRAHGNTGEAHGLDEDLGRDGPQIPCGYPTLTPERPGRDVS
jgi:hypothetical protein